MPTYQYACTECGHQLEAVQSFSDAALTECPNCHGKLRKVFNSVGIVFKGSGFYRNDSRPTGAGAEKPAAGAEPKKADAASSPSSTSTSTDKSSSTSSSTPSTSSSSSSSSSSTSSGSSSAAKAPSAS